MTFLKQLKCGDKLYPFATKATYHTATCKCMIACCTRVYRLMQFESQEAKVLSVDECTF